MYNLHLDLQNTRSIKGRSLRTVVKKHTAGKVKVILEVIYATGKGYPQLRKAVNAVGYCHTEVEVAHQTFYLAQPQYPNTGPTSPSADLTTLGAWQGSPWSTEI